MPPAQERARGREARPVERVDLPGREPLDARPDDAVAGPVVEREAELSPVEREVDCPSHPRVVEERPARVEDDVVEERGRGREVALAPCRAAALPGP